MSSGGTDVDAVSSPSSFIMAFSSIAFIKQDCSFDSVSESHQLLLCNDCEGWPHRGGGGGESFRHDVSTSPSTLTKRSRTLGTRLVPSTPLKFPRILLRRLLRMVRKKRLQPL